MVWCRGQAFAAAVAAPLVLVQPAGFDAVPLPAAAAAAATAPSVRDDALRKAVVQQARLTPEDGTAFFGDRFGESVAVDGDTALVGAPFGPGDFDPDQGAVYVFLRSGTDWVQQTRLTAGDGAPGDAFGSSVALSGDTALVGASLDDIGSAVDQGSTYVFVRSGTTWTQQAKLVAADGAAGDQFGASVALSGDTALVGALLDDIGGVANRGSAYAFVRDGAAWTQQAKLLAADGGANHQFGVSVALSGDDALVGADRIQAAYVFQRSGAAWAQQERLVGADTTASDRFGAAVALDGDTALVGAYYDDIGANVDQGSAFVFVRGAAGWVQQAKLLAADGRSDDEFGSSVALDGEFALVGAPRDVVGTQINQGSAYRFARNGETWTQVAQAVADEGVEEDYFGGAVALSGDTALVGAIGYDIGTTFNQGAAFVFVGGDAVFGDGFEPAGLNPGRSL
jgi:hypothetical protein